MRRIACNRLSKINKIQLLQQQVSFWENTNHNYRKSLEVFRDYIQILKEYNEPKSLINAFIRMGRYCEKMDDRLISCDLYQEAIDLLIKSGIGTQAHIKNLRMKINSLNYY